MHPPLATMAVMIKGTTIIINQKYQIIFVASEKQVNYSKREGEG